MLQFWVRCPFQFASSLHSLQVIFFSSKNVCFRPVLRFLVYIFGFLPLISPVWYMWIVEKNYTCKECEYEVNQKEYHWSSCDKYKRWFCWKNYACKECKMKWIRRDILPNTDTENPKLIRRWKLKKLRLKHKNVKDQSHDVAFNI